MIGGVLCSLLLQLVTCTPNDKPLRRIPTQTNMKNLPHTISKEPIKTTLNNNSTSNLVGNTELPSSHYGTDMNNPNQLDTNPPSTDITNLPSSHYFDTPGFNTTAPVSTSPVVTWGSQAGLTFSTSPQREFYDGHEKSFAAIYQVAYALSQKTLLDKNAQTTLLKWKTDLLKIDGNENQLQTELMERAYLNSCKLLKFYASNEKMQAYFKQPFWYQIDIILKRLNKIMSSRDEWVPSLKEDQDVQKQIKVMEEIIKEMEIVAKKKESSDQCLEIRQKTIQLAEQAEIFLKKFNLKEIETPKNIEFGGN